jgi:hypothetical protein
MHVDVVVTPKFTRRVICTKFRVVDGALLFYADIRMTQLLEGYKTWRRFNVIEDQDATPINLVDKTKTKSKKGV